MKIYKERQFLIFDFGNGSTVKYDFATKTTIGQKGKPVKNLCSQLQGLTIDELCDCCVDKQYGKFLRFVKDSYERRYGYRITNIGTILDKVKEYARFEQIFSAGIDEIIDRRFSYSINDIPKAIIKLCKEHSIKLSDNFLRSYKKNPDAYQLAYKLEYVSLTDNDIYGILSDTHNVKEYWGEMYYQYNYVSVSSYNTMLSDYGYTAKGLLNYIDYLVTYEALNAVDALRELHDYASMMKRISNKFDKYPRHFLTTHQIACRNYERLKEKFNEDAFKSRINKDMEHTFGEYTFIYPSCTQDIKNEAAEQNNCVASYIKRVIDGGCHILFLRKKDAPDKSLVTIEVRDGRIVQAKQKFNYPVTSEQQEAIDKWNIYYANKLKKNEREELQHVG